MIKPLQKSKSLLLNTRKEGILILLFAVCILFPFVSSAQYTNSWINYDQPHYKFPILQDGIYRITYEAMDSSGIPVASIDPDELQVFGRGEELYIYVVGDGDGSFDPGDYVEFHARRNDGYFDVGAYDQPANHANPYYSLFNDTAMYFLSWGSAGLRMQNITDTDITGITPADYFFKKNATYFINGTDGLYSNYYLGEKYAIIEGETNPQYSAGEGSFSTVFGIGGSFPVAVSTPSPYTSGPPATVEANAIGLSRGNTDPNHHTRLSVGSFSFDTLYNGFFVKHFNKQVPAANISAGATNVVIASINDLGAGTSTNAVAFASLKYPHTMALGGVSNYSNMFVPDNANSGQNKALLNFTGFTPATGTGRLFDLTNHRRITLFTNGGATAALVPDGGNEKECYLTSDAQIAINSIPLLKPVGTNSDGFFLDITNYLVPPNFYIITHKSLMQGAQEYKTYRNFSGYRAEVFDFDELCDQFGHGIPESPMCMRKFAQFANEVWGPDTGQHIFIIGKGLYPVICRSNPTNSAISLVPSFGYPTSDILITSGLPGTDLYEPLIPIGRLSARTNDDVAQYLEKVVAYEGAEPAEWRKRGLHFCGGADGNENELLCFYTGSFKDTIEGPLYGAQVQTFSKTNSLPFEITQADSIRELIEAGVSFMTFFGHASGGGFDVNTDNVETYNNQYKYPLIFGNSCLAGDIYGIPGTSTNMSEQWILADDKGAIGFIASTRKAVNAGLYFYGKEFYQNFGKDHYGSTIGNIIKHTIKNVQSPSNYLVTFPALQTILHGDPAMVINMFALPDLAISEPNVYFTNPQACCTPIEVTTELDSFDVNVIINNFGRTYEDTLTLYVRRTFPGNIDGGFVVKRFAPIYFKDTVTVRFATNQIFGIGINQLYIHVDDGPAPIIDELSEQNNFINSLSFVVLSPDIVPVYPYKFAIMGEQGITLKASTGDAFAPSRTYRLQLDTTDRFNSPLMQQTTVTQSGGVVNWTPTLLANMPDSTVYFWRASLDPTLYPTTYKWRESSFQYIEGKYGWGQAHFFQFKPDTANYEGDKYNFIEHDRPDRKFNFINTPKTLSVHNKGWPANLDEAYSILYKIDSEVEDYLACGNGANIFRTQVIAVVVDANTLEPWGTPGIDPVTGLAVNQANNFNQLNANGSCGRTRSELFFFWDQYSPASMTAFSNFLDNVVPDSNYIMLYSWIVSPFNIYGYPVPGQMGPWQADALNSLHTLGFNAIDTIDPHFPWAFFCKKGDLSTATFQAGTSSTDVVDFSATMTGTWNKGTITTPLIGPSAGWNWMYWDRHPSETPTDDTLNFKVTGIRFNGTEQDVIPYFQAYPLTGPGPDSLSLTGLIDHTEFPYIKLTAFTQDDTTRTPNQMERWQILYDQVPEAALNPSIGYEFLSPEVDQFQDILFTTAIENIGDYDMDSLLVKYWVQGANNVITDISYPRQAPLLIDDVLIDQVTVPTANFVGGNKLWVEVNPYDSTGHPDQLEQYHFNNIGFVQFTVNGDRINPILDVTFDGIHILDGDIVSARPHIVMTIDDENQYLIMDEPSDTANLSVFIIKPTSSTPERIWFDDFVTMQFTPATAPENKAKIEFPAIFPDDGIYKLIVQGSDKSNNTSGSFEYVISFEVINRSTITEVINYPNPFSTSTRFVFVLTGSVIPDYFKIQIMTITGKVVREITTDELGPVNIGRNITQYAWNGKDEFGDQLANGVYLYTVTAYINGEDIEHRNSGADKFFKKNFGKMFLMR